MLQIISRRLGRLSVGRKLLVIYLLDLTAVIFISGILINEKFIAIDFGRKEMTGLAYIKELQPSLLALAGWREARVASDAVLAQVERQLGDGMRTAEPSLGFRRAVTAAQEGVGTEEGGQRDARQVSGALDALEQGRALVTRIGNQSNLILDPDLDSYYTMSLVLLRFPELMELGSSMAARLQTPGPDGLTAADIRAQYFTLEGRIDAVAAGIESDYGEAFVAANGQLRDRLGASRKRLAAGIDRFRRAARQRLETTDASAASAFDAAQQALFSDLDHAWTLGNAELGTMLQTRERGFFHRMWLHLGTALTLLLLILTAVFYVARQIAKPLRRLSDVVDTVRRTGDHSLRAEWNSGDEIGRLVLGFNDMLAQLDRERRIQQELAATARAAEAQRDLVAAIPIPMMVTAIPGHEVLNANPPAQAWLNGSTRDPWAHGLEPSVRARFFQQLADHKAVDEFEVRWRGGIEPSWAVLSARRLTYQGQDAVLTAFTPVNHLKQMEQRLELWAKVFEASSEGIMIIDKDHRILTVNRAMCRQTGHELRTLAGEAPDVLIEDDTMHFDLMWPMLDLRSSWQGEVEVRRRNGTHYPAWLVASVVRDGPEHISHYIFTSINISDRKRSEERIRFLAHHDVLTELPNRSLCIERLRMAIQQAQRTRQRVGVLFIDLDRFKNINDSLGHHVGDGLLRSVARRLTESVRSIDTVSRLGGDEFVIVLNGVADAHEILNVVERRLVPRIRKPHDVGGAELHVSCSVGIAIYPDDAQDIDTLMRHADVAMYQSKANGRDMARFFTSDMNERAQQRLHVESKLRHAIERDELTLHYQPRVHAVTGALTGVEALLRWRNDELGSVPPAEFIPIAEESGQIVAIGDWVISQACEQHAIWQREGLGRVPVSVNMSALQLRDSALIDKLREAMQTRGVQPSDIEIELTESSLMDATAETLAQLRALKALGVMLSIDDFGTGYSSLNYLHRFPIDKLKVDRSFVHPTDEDVTGMAIARAVIGLGHALGLQVVAEGVETDEEAQTLRAARCDELQGFLVGKPMAPDMLPLWLSVHHARSEA
ncbi:EAL domain-containing protein [Variovorax ginsengisoli]|uniref:Diguanylate cyclase (GGDEF)-like protein/PAS domain S-box-containing protein n=1 Tax=Variovorax ginsengisoli TaxID=363844 RepID=A0ABT9S5X5_9BURK|nr:EAL domain-containing protein [Variovorax ginsengisoli]MDP9899146.1 diguanylate cyclase (GGDEF)-like protein/PAS domain S-box-containing protein [Variovorax ginsengisoli]